MPAPSLLSPVSNAVPHDPERARTILTDLSASASTNPLAMNSRPHRGTGLDPGPAPGTPPAPVQNNHSATVVAAESPFGAFAGAGMAGTVMSFAMELTVPGRMQVPMAGVSHVAVHPLRRRRGVLRALMRCQLDDLHARGVPLAGLGASEAGIYGRFGYGAATWDSSWRLARGAARGLADGDDGCYLDMIGSRRARDCCLMPTSRPAGARWARCAPILAGGTTWPETALRWELADSRQLTVTGVNDHLWLRLVDLPEALSRRRYAAEGSLVLDVTDSFCLWNQGRWLLEGGPAGATCHPAGQSPAPALRLEPLPSAHCSWTAHRSWTWPAPACSKGTLPPSAGPS
jgi:hypothetical protein